MKYSAIIIIFFFSLSAFPQSKNELYRILEVQAKFISECREKSNKAQIEKFGRVLPEIAGECEWSSNGCPVNLPKPFYPTAAKKLKLFGMVEVEIIIDENGNVVHAKAINGNGIFYANAEKAASLSRFNPKVFCGKPVFQKRKIRYNFILN